MLCHPYIYSDLCFCSPSSSPPPTLPTHRVPHCLLTSFCLPHILPHSFFLYLLLLPLFSITLLFLSPLLRYSPLVRSYLWLQHRSCGIAIFTSCYFFVEVLCEVSRDSDWLAALHLVRSYTQVLTHSPHHHMIPYRLVERVAAVQAIELKAESENELAVNTTITSTSSTGTDIGKDIGMDLGTKIPATA